MRLGCGRQGLVHTQRFGPAAVVPGDAGGVDQLHHQAVIVIEGLDADAEAVFPAQEWRSEEHTSELQSLMRISYAIFCLKKKKNVKHTSIVPCIKKENEPAQSYTEEREINTDH